MHLKKLIILALILSSLYGFTPQSISHAELQIQDQPISNQIDYFATMYRIDSRLIAKVVECESGGVHEAVGDGHRSHGIAQFQRPTWNWMEKEFYEEYNQHLDYTSSFDQLHLLSYAISEGYGRNWTTYVAIKNGGKYSFWSNQMNRHYTVVCKL
jgi:hypothetical protein